MMQLSKMIVVHGRVLFVFGLTPVPPAVKFENGGRNGRNESRLVLVSIGVEPRDVSSRLAAHSIRQRPSSPHDVSVSCASVLRYDSNLPQFSRVLPACNERPTARSSRDKLEVRSHLQRLKGARDLS